MFGPFRSTNSLSGGLLWKSPWRMSQHQKARQRKRLRAVDNVVATLDRAMGSYWQQRGIDTSRETATSAASEGEGGSAARAQVRQMTGSGAKSSGTSGVNAIERWKTEMPTESDMPPKDKYTMFDRKARRYRKSVHKLPKWTRVSQRINPPGY